MTQPTTMTKAAVTLVPGALIGLFVGLHPAVQALLFLQFLDIISGLLAAGKIGSISSAAGLVGMKKKAMMWIYVLMASAINAVHPIGETPAAMVAALFAVLEAVSITENGGKLGLPLPPQIKRALEALQPPKQP